MTLSYMPLLIRPASLKPGCTKPLDRSRLNNWKHLDPDILQIMADL